MATGNKSVRRHTRELKVYCFLHQRINLPSQKRSRTLLLPTRIPAPTKMSDETKDVVASAPETAVEDIKMDVDAPTDAPAAEGSAAESQTNGRDNNKRDNNRGSYSKLSVIPPVKDEPGTVLPEDDAEDAKHDLTIPKIDGLEEKDVIDLLNKAAKQGEWDRTADHCCLACDVR